MEPDQQQRNPGQRPPISLTKRVPQPTQQLDQQDPGRTSIENNTEGQPGSNNSQNVTHLRINTESANATYVHNPTRPIGNSAMRGTKPPTMNSTTLQQSQPGNNPTSNPPTPQTPHTPTSPTNAFVQHNNVQQNPNSPNNPNVNPNY